MNGEQFMRALEAQILGTANPYSSYAYTSGYYHSAIARLYDEVPEARAHLDRHLEFITETYKKERAA